jgi:K+ transporter
MFIKLIFARLGWKENRWKMGIAYGTIYSLLFLLVILVAQKSLGTVKQYEIIGYALLVFVTMFLVFQIKYSVMRKAFK